MFQEENLKEEFDFTGCETTPCCIFGDGGMVYWENCYVEHWRSANNNQAPKFIRKLGESRGKWKGKLDTDEHLIFIGAGGKAKKG